MAIYKRGVSISMLVFWRVYLFSRPANHGSSSQSENSSCSRWWVAMDSSRAVVLFETIGTQQEMEALVKKLIVGSWHLFSRFFYKQSVWQSGASNLDLTKKANMQVQDLPPTHEQYVTLLLTWLGRLALRGNNVYGMNLPTWRVDFDWKCGQKNQTWILCTIWFTRYPSSSQSFSMNLAILVKNFNG